MSEFSINGFCEPEFTCVEEAFLKNFEEENEVGAAVCIFKDDKKVVDLWAGSKDEAGLCPWDENSLVNVWSTTKGATAAALAHLVTSGKMEFDAPVAKYWPEFGIAGKDELTVAQLFSHQSGVCGLSQAVSEDQMYDVEAMVNLLVNETPFWEHGTRSGYHALSIGYFADALFMRVVGETVGEYFRKNIAEPLALEFHIGLPIEKEHCIAQVLHDGLPISGGLDKLNEYQVKAQINIPVNFEMPNERRWREMGLPSAGGSANARGIASLYKTLLSDLAGRSANIAKQDVLSRAVACQIQNRDLVLGLNIDWAVGFARNGDTGMYGPNPSAFGHTGWGGSFGFGDPISGISVGYSMNYMREVDHSTGDPRVINLLTAVAETMAS